ncbi:MAG TPA: hypothetical protein PKE63_10505 [Lacibacter sp.]|nr:hypothetical protein [Lacibacter sp.]HMO87632.1 hypothetical protein [Lacibacter sp.]HMP87699.1 hypothetical protein [Lacibacter sp.]
MKRWFLFCLGLLAARCTPAQDLIALVEPAQVRLCWSSSDSLTDHFVVERRSRGGDFRTIGLVLGDVPGFVQTYEFRDKITAGEGFLYYRIKTIQAGGAVFFSEIIGVALNDVQRNPAAINYKPGSSYLQPVLPAAGGSYVCRIYNRSGELSSLQRTPSDRPRIRLRRLQSGFYLVEFFHPPTGRRYYGSFHK